MSGIPELHGFIWIENIKKHAKGLKKIHPGLGYLERLEVAAHEFAGKRDYHECHNLHEKHLLSYRHVEGQSVKQQIYSWKCAFCGLSFRPNQKEDEREHQQRHKLFEAAYYRTGYNPDCYVIREEKKRAAWKRYNSLLPNENNEASKSEVAIALYRRFYDRSFEKAILCEYWEQHPAFEQYVAMVEIQSSLWPRELENIIHKKFGTLTGHIPPGHTYWTPKDRNIWY